MSAAAGVGLEEPDYQRGSKDPDKRPRFSGPQRDAAVNDYPDFVGKE